MPIIRYGILKQIDLTVKRLFRVCFSAILSIFVRRETRLKGISRRLIIYLEFPQIAAVFIHKFPKRRFKNVVVVVKRKLFAF